MWKSDRHIIHLFSATWIDIVSNTKKKVSHSLSPPFATSVALSSLVFPILYPQTVWKNIRKGDKDKDCGHEHDTSCTASLLMCVLLPRQRCMCYLKGFWNKQGWSEKNKLNHGHKQFVCLD